MSDFRTNVRDAIEALVKIGYNKSDALDLIWRDNPKLFLNHFTGTDNIRRYYRLDYNPYAIIDDDMKEKLRDRRINVLDDERRFYVKDKKITAIKFVRALTNFSLKDAKEFVEGSTRHLTDDQYEYLLQMFGSYLMRDFEYEHSIGGIFENLTGGLS